MVKSASSLKLGEFRIPRREVRIFLLAPRASSSQGPIIHFLDFACSLSLSQEKENWITVHKPRKTGLVRRAYLEGPSKMERGRGGEDFERRPMKRRRLIRFDRPGMQILERGNNERLIVFVVGGLDEFKLEVCFDNVCKVFGKISAEFKLNI